MNEAGRARDIWSALVILAGEFPQRGAPAAHGRCGGLYWTSGQVDGITVLFGTPGIYPDRRAMKQFWLKFFTWWSGQTFGTQLWTWRFGELVGNDEQGNRYFRTRGGKIDPTLGFERRWVVYDGYAEATKVPPSWHGWLHHTVDVPPTDETYTPRDWEKPHIPNLTGTPAAYRPSGSTLASGRRPKATGDYQPWTPGN
jgi:NADH:ubiquinone oxidoreductase subunit